MNKVNKNLCYNFLRGLALVFLFVFFLLFGPNAKASTIISDLPMTGSTILIPSHTADSIMFCTYKQDRNYNELLDDIGTFSSLFYRIDSGRNKMTVYYQINPTTGYHVLTGEYYSAFSCFFVDGVNTSSFLNTYMSDWGSQGWTADASFTYNATSTDSLVLGFGHTHLTYWSGITSMYGTGSTTVINYFQAYYAGDSQSFYQFSNSSKALTFNLHGSTSAGPQEWVDINRALFVELDTHIGPQTCTSFTYTPWTNCVNGQQERDIATKSPSGCNIDYINNPYDILLRQCNNNLKIYLPYNWQGYMFDQTSQNYYSRFQYLYNTEAVTSTSDYIKMYRCNSDCTTLTPVVFDNGVTTTTELSILSPFGITSNTTYPTGTSMFIIQQPSDLNINTSTNLTYRFYYYHDSTDSQTELRTINWGSVSDYQNKYPTNDDGLPACLPPSYDITTICEGIDTSGTLGYVQCSIKYALVSASQFMFYPSCSSLYDITNNYDKFKHSFPFNTYFDLTSSISKAIDTSLSTSTTQSLSIPFIRKTATSSEYYMLPVISSTTITNTIGTTNYNTLKLTFGFIWWVISAVIVFLIVTKI